MAKGLIQYSLIALFLFGMWSLLLGYFPFLLCLCFLLLFFLSFLLSHQAMKKTRVTMKIESLIWERKDSMDITFHRENFTTLHNGKIIIDYIVRDSHQNQVLHDKLILYDEKISTTLSLKHCDYYEVHIQKIYCFDILQCLYLKHNIQEIESFYIFPSLISTQGVMETPTTAYAESYEYATEHKGDDYSETFDIRAYQSQDSLKHIHWKVSMKKDELFVKEGSQPIVKKILLAIQFLDNANDNDAALDSFYSLCMNLYQNNIDFEILCPQVHSSLIAAEHIGSIEHLQDCMKRLLREPIHDIQKVLHEFQDYSTVYLIKQGEIEVIER